MAAPVVIRQGEDPLTNAIQFAGKSIRDSIGLMNQAQQIQVMKDQNRIEAGKTLLANNWNMFNDLSREMGPEAAWDKLKMGFASSFKMLDMPDEAINDFNSAMTSGPISQKGMMTALMNDWVQGKGSLRNVAPDRYTQQAETDRAQFDEMQKANAAATVTPAVGEGTTQTTYTPVSKQIQWDDWISLAADKPVPGKPVVEVSNQNRSTVNQIGKEIGEKKQITDALGTAGPINLEKPAIPSPIPRSSAAPSATPTPTPTPPITYNKVTKSASVVGPSVPFNSPQEREEFIAGRVKEYAMTGGIGPGAARMLAVAAADLSPKATVKVIGGKATVTQAPTTPTTPLAPPVPKDSSPPKWSASLTTTPGWRDLKKEYDPSDQMTDEDVARKHKPFYEYWVRELAGVKDDGANKRLTQQLRSSLLSSPTLSDRFSTSDSMAYLGTFDPSGRGDPAAGLETFQRALHPEEYKMGTDRLNAMSNVQQADTATYQAHALDDPEQGMIWQSNDPMTRAWRGQKVSMRQFGILSQMFGNLLDYQSARISAAGTAGKQESELYMNASKAVQAAEADMRKDALKAGGADGFKVAQAFNALQEAFLKTADASDYRKQVGIMKSYEESWGWVEAEPAKATNRVFRGPFGLMRLDWIPGYGMQTTIAPTTVLTPPSPEGQPSVPVAPPTGDQAKRDQARKSILGGGP